MYIHARKLARFSTDDVNVRCVNPPKRVSQSVNVIDSVTQLHRRIASFELEAKTTFDLRDKLVNNLALERYPLSGTV